MTIEETKKAIEVMQAYADGKKIECRELISNVFEEITNPIWDWDTFEYRVKPEPKVRPYANAEEFLDAMMQHGPMLKHAVMGHYKSISSIDKNGIYFDFAIGSIYSYEDVLKCYTWQDGTPCGIIEE